MTAYREPEVLELLTEFQRLCMDWEGSPDGFAQIIREALASLPGVRLALAHQFEVAESTVSRWAAGTVKPHPRVQKSVVCTLLRRVRGS